MGIVQHGHGAVFVSQIADLLSSSFYGEVDLHKVVKIGTFLIIIYCCALVLSYFQGFIMNTVTQRTAYGLRKDICRKINNLPLKYFDSHLIGDILSRVVNDVDTIAMTLNQSVGNLFNAGTQFIAAMIIMSNELAKANQTTSAFSTISITLKRLVPRYATISAMAFHFDLSCA